MPDFITRDDLQNSPFEFLVVHKSGGSVIGDFNPEIIDLINHKITIKEFNKSVTKSYEDYSNPPTDEDLMSSGFVKTTKKPRSRSGYIYLMINRRNGYIKIGFTTNKPGFREKTLQSEEPEVKLIHASYGFTINDEHDIHGELTQFRVRGEWFDLPDVVLDGLKAELINKQKHGKFNTVRGAK